MLRCWVRRDRFGITSGREIHSVFNERTITEVCNFLPELNPRIQFVQCWKEALQCRTQVLQKQVHNVLVLRRICVAAAAPQVGGHLDVEIQ